MKYFFLLFFFSLAGAGCILEPDRRPPLPLDGNGMNATEYSKDLFAEATKVTKKAKETLNPEICLQLPLKGALWIDNGWDELYWGTMPMRSYCLFGLMQISPTERTCSLLSEVPKSDLYQIENTDSCYSSAAEKENDVDLCDLVLDQDAKTECIALAKKDGKLCEAIKHVRSKQDINEYLSDKSPSAGTCVQAVVLRTHDYKTCELIDGPRFGTNWQGLRNHCLEIAGYLLKKDGKSYQICGSFVEDDSRWGARSNCLVGTFIDPNDFWTSEQTNVLHVLPGNYQ